MLIQQKTYFLQHRKKKIKKAYSSGPASFLFQDAQRLCNRLKLLGFLQKCQGGNLIPKLNPGAVLLSVTIQTESLKEKQGLQSHFTKGITSGAIYLLVYFNSTPNKNARSTSTTQEIVILQIGKISLSLLFIIMAFLTTRYRDTYLADHIFKCSIPALQKSRNNSNKQEYWK